MNISDSPVILRRNAKLADVFTCLAMEDMENGHPAWCEAEITCANQATSPTVKVAHADISDVQGRLKHMGLDDLDLESCDVSMEWRSKLADLVIRYEDVFSRHHLDCGEAKGFVHRIHLTDEAIPIALSPCSSSPIPQAVRGPQ